ncbi:flagellar filament capping protein FliD [Paenibacillus sp. FA6]|uniref:flagellar filament capping protein FliD n=1 Tax=Paenibacillus sp. FA6 TaxID=3413029 RepID=UPI003F65D056
MVMRIGGLASGMNIDDIVKNMMTASKFPLNKLNQQKQQTEWKREGYRTISTTLVSFNDKLSTFGLSSSINSKKATVTGASNVTATATGSATNSVINISVGNLASASSVVSSPAKPGATKISDLYSGTDMTIKIGEGTIGFDADDTIASLVSKINNDKTTGVTAVYDQKSGQMSLTNIATGSVPMEVEGGLLAAIGINNTTASAGKGTDATVIINGISTTQSSNTFTVNGVTISIHGVTPTDQSTQIQVNQDTDKMVDTIKSFVESYNATIATLNLATSEERFRTYLPLTTEQRAAMSEDEIKLWETKAKSGMLKSDPIIDKALSEMRTAIIGGLVTPNITQFGITTGNYSEKGKLIIDETKLKAALEANPEDVFALFGQVDNSKPAPDKIYNEDDGIFSRLKKVGSVILTSLSEKAGTSKYSSDLTTAFLVSSQMGDQLKIFDTRIADINRRLASLEARYYKQFTAMETAMNKFNSTSSSLSSMLS